MFSSLFICVLEATLESSCPNTLFCSRRNTGKTKHPRKWAPRVAEPGFTPLLTGVGARAGWDWPKTGWGKARRENWSAEGRQGLQAAHAVGTEKVAGVRAWLARKSAIAIGMNDSQRDLELI